MLPKHIGVSQLSFDVSLVTISMIAYAILLRYNDLHVVDCLLNFQ
jgi:hypothetical protein